MQGGLNERKNNKNKPRKKGFKTAVITACAILAVVLVIVFGATALCYISAGEAPKESELTNPFIKANGRCRNYIPIPITKFIFYARAAAPFSYPTPCIR